MRNDVTDTTSLVKIPVTEYKRICVIWSSCGRSCSEIYGFVLIGKEIVVDNYPGDHARKIVGDEKESPSTLLPSPQGLFSADHSTL